MFGPSIGAAFAVMAKDQEGMFFMTPALFALALAVADVLFLYVCFTETLPKEKRVRNLCN